MRLLNVDIYVIPGEVERLLREYTQNQEMVRNIGSHYYQIIYPVQLRQHKKMGISTREIGSSKVRKARSTVCHSTFSSHCTHKCKHSEKVAYTTFFLFYLKGLFDLRLLASSITYLVMGATTYLLLKYKSSYIFYQYSWVHEMDH